MSDESNQDQRTSGNRWGDSITPERQAELKELADQQRKWVVAPDSEGRESYFARVGLTGADVFWLAAYALVGPEGDLAAAQDRLRTAHERGEFIDLSALHLERAVLREAHLEGALLYQAHLEGANLRWAHLEGALLEGAHLEGKTYPPGGADLARIQQWAPGFPATLPPADLRLAFLNTATTLDDIHLGDATAGTVQVADVRWGGVNLAVVDWTAFTDRKAVLGDEQAARDWKAKPFSETEEQQKQTRQERARARAEHTARQDAERLAAFQTAVRANRQLATVLRDQGMNEEADYFAYRAQLVQHRVLGQQGKRGRQLLSWFLDLSAGYGYRPLRSVIAYVLIIGAFAGAYLLNGQFATPHLRWDEALVLSVSSFHGRGFFSSGISLGDTLARLAAGEAIIGLLIEITFIATFTNRFFAR